MMTRRLLIAALYICVADFGELNGVVQADTKLLIVPTTLIDNQFFFGRTVGAAPTVTQRVLTTSRPSLLGLSRADTTIIFPTSVTDAAVIASTTEQPSAMRVEGIRLWGSHGNLTAGQWPDPPNDTEVADGIRLFGQVAKAVDVRVERFRGAGIDMTSGTQVHHCDLSNLYVGVDVQGADCMVFGTWVQFCRDACVRVASGNFSSTHNHYFGADRGASVLLANGGESRFVNDVIADSKYGIDGTGGFEIEFVGCKINQNFDTAAFFLGNDIKLIGCQTHVNAASTNNPEVHGLDFRAAAVRGQVIGGTIILTNEAGASVTATGPAQEAVKIASDHFTLKDVDLIDADTFDGSLGIRVNGAVKNLQIDINVNGPSAAAGSGFGDVTSKIIIFDAAASSGMRAANIVIRSADSTLTAANVGDKIDIADTWDATNSITFINTITGAKIELSPLTAY